MPLLFDTSSLLKAYVDEAGSEQVKQIVARPKEWGGLFVSDFIAVEIVSALMRLLRGEQLTAELVREAVGQFREDYERAFDVTRVDADIMERAANILLRCTERRVQAGDGIHLATAERLAEKLSVDTPLVLIASDGGVKWAAPELLGLPCHDPEESPLTHLGKLVQ